MFIDSQFCRRFYLYLVPFGIGCLAKPIAAMFAPLLLLYVILFEEKLALTELFAKRKFPRTWSALKKSLPAIGLCLLVLFFIKNMEVPTWIPGGTSQYHYIITQPYVVLHYFTTLFFPISLSADTDWRPLHTIMDARFFVGMLFISVLFYAAVATSKREHLRPVSFGICWFFITVIPTSLIPLAEVMNDHRIFFPYVGLVMSVCWTLFLVFMRIKDSFANERVFVRATASVIVIVLAIYAYGTFQRNKVWKTEETLWQDVTVKSPKNGRGLMNYGLALMGRGEYTGAERYFGRALELNPYYVFLHINMGVLKDATGRHSEAEQYFKNAISFGPSYPESYFYYARSLKNRGRTKDAIWNLEKALQLAPACLDARDLLMDIYFEKPDFGKLGQLAAQTLTIVPNDRKSVLYLDLIKQGKSRLDLERQRVIENKSPEGFLNLSLMYYQAGEYERSIEAAQEALKLRPNYDLAYNNICAAYNELEQWDRAIEAGEKAVKINPNSQIARNNLAWAKQQNMLLQKEQK
jgi:tetratricopeptide (TPR) repeat protein